MAYFVNVKGTPTRMEDFVIVNSGNTTVFPPSNAMPGVAQAPFMNQNQPSVVVQSTTAPSKSVTFFIDRTLEAEERYEVYEDAKLFGTIRVQSCLPVENLFQVHATMR